MRDLLIIVPTRGRPAGFRRLVDAIRATSTGAPQILACVDRDDASRYEPIEDVWYIIKERRRYVALVNDASRHCADEFRHVGVIGDDSVPLTQGWDAAVSEVLDELGTGLCYANDLNRGEELPTVCFMTTDIVQALGYMVPPGLVHMFSDNFWLELGRATDRIRYLPDVLIEHLHHSVGKAPNDTVYEESESVMVSDREAFAGYLRDDFESDVAKVQRLVARQGSRRAACHEADAGRGDGPRGAVGEIFEAATLTLSEELASERAARQAAESELAAVRRTRSYRWLAPARRLRSMVGP